MPELGNGAESVGRFTTSQAGIDLIKSFEGLRLKTYLCAAGVKTIGFGHTGRDVTDGLVITEARAEELLRGDLLHFENAVNKYASHLNQNRFDALVSFSFNCGITAMRGSTLLKRHNAGDFRAAADQFLRWNKAGRTILPGLTRRRSAERRMYLGE